MSNSNKVKTATEEEHNAAIALMRTFMYSDKPKVGIFWFPKGRVLLENGSFYAIVGSWINESDVIDSGKLRELIVDEFDLPEDFIFKEE